MKTKLIFLLVSALTMSFATAESLTSTEVVTDINGKSGYADGMSSIRSSTPINLAMADNSGHRGYKMGDCWVKNDPNQDEDLYDNDSFDDDND